MDQVVGRDSGVQRRGRKPRSRKRFDIKRDRIIAAATDLINERGMKGTTLLDVARSVGLNTTSVTYYFRRKELLASAVFEQSMGRLEAMVDEAGSEATPQARVACFLSANIELRAQVTRGEGFALTKLSEIRTLEEAIRIPLEKHFQAIFRKVRSFFGPARSDRHKALLTARAHMLLEVVFWLPVWISQYALIDFPRVQANLIDILMNGLAGREREWAPKFLGVAPGGAGDDMDEGMEGFLRVATLLINEAGYRGASVVRISNEANVTKGSFYHHLEGKDDLVIECFRRSYRRFSGVISLAEEADASGWRQLETAIATLLNIQFYRSWPLLRTSALQSLPATVRADVVARSNRTALRFSGILIDGMRNGSVRIVDPLVASQLIIATVNTAYDLRKWASKLPPETAIAYYASSMVHGLFDDRAADRFP